MREDAGPLLVTDLEHHRRIEVHVDVDEPGHHPGAAGINLGGSARHLLPWTDGQDAIVANDDVDIGCRRAAVSIDQGGAAHDDGRALHRRGLR